MSATLRVRRAGPTDVPVLAVLHAACFGEDAWNEMELWKILHSPGAAGLIGFVDGEPAGFSLLRAVAGEAEILAIGAAPASRRRGLGRALLDASLGLAAAAGAATMFLEVAVDNDAARALYAAAGFRQVAVRRGYYARADGVVDALLLRRDLDAGDSARWVAAQGESAF